MGADAHLVHSFELVHLLRELGQLRAEGIVHSDHGHRAEGDEHEGIQHRREMKEFRSFTTHTHTHTHTHTQGQRRVRAHRDAYVGRKHGAVTRGMEQRLSNEAPVTVRNCCWCVVGVMVGAGEVCNEVTTCGRICALSQGSPVLAVFFPKYSTQRDINLGYLGPCLTFVFGLPRAISTRANW